MLSGKSVGRGVLAALSLMAIGSMSASASTGWGPPPERSGPRPSPLAPQGVPLNQGPVTFDESEFTPGEVIPIYPPSSKVLNTLDGVPIPEIGLACVDVSEPFAEGGGGGDDCTVNSGPGAQLYVQPPGIEGPADIRDVTVGFHTPTTAFSFGFTASCEGIPQSAVEVIVIDGEGLEILDTLDLFLVDTGGDYPEGQAVYEAPAGETISGFFVAAGAIANEGCARFFFDNLRWQTDAVATVVAVPAISPAGAIGLASVLGLAALTLLRRRRSTSR